MPFGTPPDEKKKIIANFKHALEEYDIKVPGMGSNLFYYNVFKDGAFTSTDPKIRALAVRKSMDALDIGAELGIDTYIIWSGRDGIEVEASKDPIKALEHFRDCLNFLADYVKIEGIRIDSLWKRNPMSLEATYISQPQVPC